MLAGVNVSWDLPQDQVQLFLSNKSIGMFFPMKGDKISRVIMLNENKAGLGDVREHLTTEEPLSLDEVQANFSDAVKRELTIHNATWLSRYHVHHRSVERMQVGPVFLAAMPPIFIAQREARA